MDKGNLKIVGILAVLFTASIAFAATTPVLGTVDTFAVLSSTYTDTSAATTVNGDVGYTTPPATVPTINGTTHIADAAYNQAGTDQGTSLVSLNSQPCDFNFVIATDLSSLPQPLAPGVYCVTGATSIGTAITLDAGTYIFRIDGAFDTVANSQVTLNAGASTCDVFWTPTGATTLGANSTFVGTVIDDAGITVGSTVTWTGRALSFGGTITTDADTISVPVCAVAPLPPIIPPVPPAPPVVIPTLLYATGNGRVEVPPVVEKLPEPVKKPIKLQNPKPTPSLYNFVPPNVIVDAIPSLPHAGVGPEEHIQVPRSVVALIIIAFFISVYFFFKKPL